MELMVRYMRKPKNKLHFKRYKTRLYAAFDEFVSRIRRDSFTLNSWHDGRKRFYVPALDVYVYYPNPHTGYGCIRINNPTKTKLEQVQNWLISHFNYLLYPDDDPIYRTTLNDFVKLHKVELAYDLYFQGGTQEDYAALALRLGRNIFPIGAINTFAIAIVGDPKRCRDNAVNGSITIYVQSCSRGDRFVSSERLHRNKKAATHTKIYPKLQNGIWTLRTEMTPNPPKLKALLKKRQYCFDSYHMAKLLDICRQIPFSELYEFKEADPISFAKYIQAPTSSLKDRIKACVFEAGLRHTAKMAVAEQIRAMSNGCCAYKIHQMRKARLISKISFEQSANNPPQKGFYMAQRKGKKPLPKDVLTDDRPDVVLMPFHKEQPEPPKKLERRKSEKPRWVQMPLPAPISRADGPLPNDFAKGDNSIGRSVPCPTGAILGDSVRPDTLWGQLIRERLRGYFKKESFIKVALRRRLAARCPPRE